MTNERCAGGSNRASLPIPCGTTISYPEGADTYRSSSSAYRGCSAERFRRLGRSALWTIRERSARPSASQKGIRRPETWSHCRIRPCMRIKAPRRWPGVSAVTPPSEARAAHAGPVRARGCLTNPDRPATHLGAIAAQRRFLPAVDGPGAPRRRQGRIRFRFVALQDRPGQGSRCAAYWPRFLREDSAAPIGEMDPPTTSSAPSPRYWRFRTAIGCHFLKVFLRAADQPLPVIYAAPVRTFGPQGLCYLFG